MTIDELARANGITIVRSNTLPLPAGARCTYDLVSEVLASGMQRCRLADGHADTHTIGGRKTNA